MRLTLLLFVAAVVHGLTGCSAGDKAAASQVLANIHALGVVAVEPPPLVLAPAFVRAASATPEFAFGGPGAGGLGLIGGIVALTQLPEAEHDRRAALESLDRWYASGEVWLPSVALADLTVRVLDERTGVRAARSRDLYRLPNVSQRAATWHMANWYGPIRDWYNADTADDVSKRIAGAGFRSEAIVEVAISHFEILDDVLLFEVLTKLVSLEDGRVLARARTDVTADVAVSAELFADGASRFKSIFIAAARVALERNLKTMNLLP